jgi:hypothetical protein
MALDLSRRIDINVTIEKLARLSEIVAELSDKKLDKQPFIKLNDYVRSSIRSLDDYYSDIVEAHRKSLDFTMRYTPKLIRNMINEVMNKVLTPLRLKELFTMNVKPYQWIEDPNVLYREKAMGGDGKPHWNFVEEKTDDEAIDSAIETPEVRNWKEIKWDKAKQRIKKHWIEILEA